MYLRELNNEGVKLFADFLRALHKGDNPEYPKDLLTDEKYSICLGNSEVLAKKTQFGTKLELVTEIDRLFEQSSLPDYCHYLLNNKNALLLDLNHSLHATTTCMFLRDFYCTEFL